MNPISSLLQPHPSSSVVESIDSPNKNKRKSPLANNSVVEKVDQLYQKRLCLINSKETHALSSDEETKEGTGSDTEESTSSTTSLSPRISPENGVADGNDLSPLSAQRALFTPLDTAPVLPQPQFTPARGDSRRPVVSSAAAYPQPSLLFNSANPYNGVGAHDNLSPLNTRRALFRPSDLEQVRLNPQSTPARAQRPRPIAFSAAALSPRLSPNNEVADRDDFSPLSTRRALFAPLDTAQVRPLPQSAPARTQRRRPVVSSAAAHPHWPQPFNSATPYKRVENRNDFSSSSTQQMLFSPLEELPLQQSTPPRAQRQISSTSSAASFSLSDCPSTPPRREFLGKGLNHNVYSSGMSRCGKYETVGKSVIQSKNKNETTTIHFESFISYIRLLQNDVPVAKVFSIPAELENLLENQKGALYDQRITDGIVTEALRDIKAGGKEWIIEKLAIPAPKEEWENNNREFNTLSPRAQSFLTMAKEWLNRSIAANKILIGDFKPDNVMMTAQEEIKIIDYDFKDAAVLKKGVCDFEFFHELQHSLKYWSCGNENIKNWLMDEFPESIRESIQHREEIKSRF
ncbi:MAG: hypothetical protein WDZ27_01780 [Waddliaceae bacterium]